LSVLESPTTTVVPFLPEVLAGATTFASAASSHFEGSLFCTTA
jgi:hypothetical protein